MDKINISIILRAHFETFYSYGSKDKNKFEVFIFFFIPLILGGLYVFNYESLKPDVTNSLISAASIVSGLLLNLMVLLYNLIFNSRNNISNNGVRSDFKKLCKEVLASISFLIIICLLLIISSFFCNTKYIFVNMASSFLAVSCSVMSILNLLLIIKRCYIIVNYDISH